MSKPHDGMSDMQDPEAGDAAFAAEEPIDETPEPVVTQVEQEVEITRSVRYGRILIVCGFIGAILAAMITLMLPVDPEEHYTMQQIVGFMLVVGAAVGLTIGAILSLILSLVARKHRGSGVAIQTDVRQ